MVVHRGSSRRGDLSSLELSRPNVLVRHLQPGLGRGHGCRPVRFRSLVGRRGVSLDQPTRGVGCRERPQGSLYLFGRSGCRSLLRQHDHGGVSEKARRDLVSGSERGSPAHSALGGAVEYHPDASVCSREEQCGSRRVVSPRPGSRLGVDTPSGCVQLAPPALAGDNRSVCLLTQSPLLCLFCAGVPMAAGMDAMLQSWDSLQAYAFPPFAMISHVLAKVRASRSLELTLIVPFWPQRPWFPELLILPPLPLPSRWDLLRQPHVRRFNQNLSMFRLRAWRDSGDSREPLASLVAWLDGLGRQGGSLQ